jgi:hypothetical protein
MRILKTCLACPATLLAFHVITEDLYKLLSIMLQDVSGSPYMPLSTAEKLLRILQPGRWPRAFECGGAIEYRVRNGGGVSVRLRYSWDVDQTGRRMRAPYTIVLERCDLHGLGCSRAR